VSKYILGSTAYLNNKICSIIIRYVKVPMYPSHSNECRPVTCFSFQWDSRWRIYSLWAIQALSQYWILMSMQINCGHCTLSRDVESKCQKWPGDERWEHLSLVFGESVILCVQECLAILCVWHWCVRVYACECLWDLCVSVCVSNYWSVESQLVSLSF